MALPTLVIAKPVITDLFREEWPAAACIPRQAADDLIEPTLSRFWLLRSVIASALQSDPDGCRNTWFALQGRVEKMIKCSITTAGIDTSKLKLDIAIHQRPERWQVPNTLPGWQLLISHLSEASVTRVGIEATGGYEAGIVEHLRLAGFTVLVMQPIQVKAFGRVHLRRAKNDALDAALIAACAATLDPPKIAPDPRLAELAQEMTFLEQIEEDIARFKTRLEHIGEPRLKRMVNSDLARLKARRTTQIRMLAKHLRGHDDLPKRFDLVLSVPGIGERTALALVIRMPELGQISREEAAALAGLAPFDNDSGQFRGQRKIAGGRGRLRKSLYAAALPAAFKWNKALMELYGRLRAKGKEHNLALIACARKLLVYANTVVQRGTPWVENTAS